MINGVIIPFPSTKAEKRKLVAKKTTKFEILINTAKKREREAIHVNKS